MFFGRRRGGRLDTRASEVVLSAGGLLEGSRLHFPRIEGDRPPRCGQCRRRQCCGNAGRDEAAWRSLKERSSSSGRSRRCSTSSPMSATSRDTTRGCCWRRRSRPGRSHLGRGFVRRSGRCGDRQRWRSTSPPVATASARPVDAPVQDGHRGNVGRLSRWRKGPHALRWRCRRPSSAR